MAKHDFRYFFHEGLSNMFSHGFMSFAAIGITVACLLIMGTFTLVAVNANALLADLEQENEILAYVDDSYTEEQAKALQSQLEKVPNVASATYISKEEAMEDFINLYIQKVNGRFDTKGLMERTLAYIPITCLRGITWCAMAWVQYQQPDKLLFNQSTFQKLGQYLDMEFLEKMDRL